MSHYASLLMLALACKLFVVAVLARLLMRRGRENPEAFVAAWLGVHVGLIAIMLVLSACGWLTAAALWAVLGIMVVGSAIVLRQSQTEVVPLEDYWKSLQDPLVCAPILAAFVTFAALAYHGFLFSEVNTGGSTAASVRAAVERGSFFHSLPSHRDHYDGWNGELSSLYYFLLSRNDLALGFANAEVFLICCVGFAWTSGIVGVPTRFHVAVGFVLACIPLSVGAYSGHNGDALVCLCLLLSCSWLRRARDNADAVTLCAALAALGLALGTRAYAALPVAVILPFVVAANHVGGARQRLLWAAGIVLFAVGGIGAIAGLAGFSTGGAVPTMPTPPRSWAKVAFSIRPFVPILVLGFACLTAVLIRRAGKRAPIVAVAAIAFGAMNIWTLYQNPYWTPTSLNEARLKTHAASVHKISSP